MRIISALLILALVLSCAAVKTGGEVTREVGETLDEAGNKKERKGTFMGKCLNLVGGLYAKIGGAVEDMADDGENTNKSKGQLVAEANKKVVAAAVTETKEFTGHDQVYDVQQSLRNLGYSPGPVDGVWGEKTEKALMKFQKDNNIVITGKIDKATLNALGL